MVKNKKNLIKKRATTVVAEAVNKQESRVEESEENDAYDSMIENGTSDEEEDEVACENDESDSDDGFDELVTKDNKRKNVAEKRKPEAPTIASANTAKKTKTDKVKPPTLDEINELKETRNLFHSNLFRLQVKEMLLELKIKDKYKKYINNWLEQFKLFVSKLASAPLKEDMNTMKWLLKSKVKVPLDLSLPGQKTFQFQFIKPTVEPFLIGAAATQTLVGPQLVADICLTIPADCFQKENYLNIVYDQKRAYYLTYIANEMLKSKQFEGLSTAEIKFNYYENNPLKPVLEITPPVSAGSIANKLKLRLFVAAEEKSFKLSRFVPWNNNIRAGLFDNSVDEETELSPIATPHYNAGVLFDLTMQRNQQLLLEVFETHKNFQEGLVLLKVWLQQRQLNMGNSGLHTHVLAMFMAYLWRQRKLHANMSSYQVARTIWNQLAHSTWDESGKGISLCSNEKEQHNQPTIEQFHDHYEVVFIDITGFYNICANLSLELYRRVRMESKLAVDMLNDMKLNSFQLIFMTKCPLYTQFDHILKIEKTDAVEQILEMYVTPADKNNYAGYAFPLLLKTVTSLLRRGINDRVHSLLPIEKPTSAWSCTENAPNIAKFLHLGIVLNPEHAFEVLDKGPESIAKEAEDFRKFWGDKAQLRRFQDGSITESVVWATSTDTMMKKRLIVRSIVLHLLQHHFQLDPKDIDYIGGELDIAYTLTSSFKVDRIYEKYTVQQDTDAEAVSLLVIRCFDDLARRLHGLNELPLEIVSIAGISPVFRYCEPTPVLPVARIIDGQFHAFHVQRVVMQLGLSGRWPSELPALRALLTAFYIQIAKLLREKHHLRTKVTYDGVLVLKQGYCFAIEIAHPKEVALLKKEKTDRGITQYVDCEASIALEKRHYILPKVTGALHALHQLHPSFGGTAMIAKRWLYSQLIDDGLWPDECTELLIAAQFLKTHAQHVSSSPQTGFIRFLQLLAYTDWKTELFLINFNNALDESEVSDLEQRFHTNRDAFPALCIATAYDQKHQGLLWTSNLQPNINVLARVTILARQALAIVEPALLSKTIDISSIQKLWYASNQGYDLVIQLKPDCVPNTLAFQFGSPFAVLGVPNWRLPLADTNFLKESVAKLREGYANFAAFFYNPCGGKEIGIVWKPQAFDEKEFKVSDVNGCNLSLNGSKVQCQKETLIQDFKFILKDFYLRIDSVEEVRRASRISAVTNKINHHEKPLRTQSNKPKQNLLKFANNLKKLNPQKLDKKINTKNIAKMQKKKVKTKK